MDHVGSDFQQIIMDRKGGKGEALWITLNNLQMHNALTDTMQLELIEALTFASKETSIRCVVLTGAGEKAFCSGGDISLLQKMNNRDGYDYFYKRGFFVQQLLTTMNKPVIAAVHGYCFAGGLELALCCDMVYAAESAKFALTEVNLGILPGWGGSVRLPRQIGVNRAKEMIITGERIDAEEAYRIGLINKVFPANQLISEVDNLVEAILAKPPLAVRAAKTLIHDSLSCSSMDAAATMERGMLMWLINTVDFQEGTAAFLEKRKGIYKGI
ncbi:enoyl-CoA hydratase [Clostridia bacterium]|nr:enoyl-CoA hydratase [Clostridia bacterium]